MSQLPPYGAQHHPGPHAGYVDRTTNGLAIAALVLGLCGFAIVPVIFGHVALRQINRNQQAGYAMAVAGLVLGYLQIVLYLFVALLVAGGAFAIFGAS